MAFRKIDPKVDFPALERGILEFWDETSAFEKLREIHAGKPPWSFLDGPITANNPMGVHHAWGRTYKDLYQRYHASIGRDLRYQNGFDCQGLWVEVEVEKQHKFQNKKDIEKYGIGRFVEECKARAQKFADVQSNQSHRLGYWMDWDDSYYTMSDGNNYGIWAFLKKCHERELVYKGADVMPWCPRCGTGISQMEMNEGYREVAHTSVFAVFPLRDRAGESLLVWTTTPWTLTSNVAAAVNPAMMYRKIRVGDHAYWVGKGNFENPRSHPIEGPRKSKVPGLMSLEALFKNRGAWEAEDEVLGEELVGLAYDGPFDTLEGAAEAVDVHRVIAWGDVSESEGTGIVHIAPGCGSEDYGLGKALGLPKIAPLAEDGTFGAAFGFLAGRRFDQVADDIIADLRARDRLFAKEQYHHRYPHCWRCKDELVYRLVDEWFIDMKWRDEIMESTRQAKWIPSWGEDREIDWLRNMGDWMISKKRYWGLALPIWECGECRAFDVIGSREELEERAVSGWDEFEGNSPHRPWIDAVKIRCSSCGSENVSRVTDVGNPWLDASIVPFSTMGYFTDREFWEKWFPAEFVVEALPGQFRNWFYALLTVSTMMVGRAPFKILKGHGLVLDDEGDAMHKSAGNAIEFNQAADEIGVDVMRWLYAATSPERNVKFGPVHTDEVRRDVILPWWNVYAFFSNLARVDGFDLKAHAAPEAARTTLDRWILSELHRLVAVAHESYSGFDVGRFCAEAKRFIEVLSTWYVRRSRRRFYGDAWPDDKRAVYSTLYEVLVTFNRIVAPIVPFLSESIYQNLVVAQDGQAPASVHHVPFPEAQADLVDASLAAKVDACIRLVSLGRAARKDSGLKVRQPLKELVLVTKDDVEREAAEVFRDHFFEELNVLEVTLRENGEGLFTLGIAPNMKTLGPKYGRNAAGVKTRIAELDPGAVQAAFDRGETFPLGIDGVAGGDAADAGDAVLEPADVRITRSWADGWSGAATGTTVALIDTRLTPELLRAGAVRDLIRNVQSLRKDAGLDLGDRIRLALLTDSTEIRAAIGEFRELIGTETLAVEIRDTALEGAPARVTVEVQGAPVELELAKAD